MDKKEFKKLTLDIFNEYGFVYKEKRILKELVDLFLEIFIDKTVFGGDYYYLYVRVYLKSIHGKLHNCINFKDWDFSFRFEVSNLPFKINYLDLDSTEYTRQLKSLIDAHIVPIIKDEMKCLLMYDRFKFSPKARKFLNLQ